MEAEVQWVRRMGRVVFFVLISIWSAVLIISINGSLIDWQRKVNGELPYGFIRDSSGHQYVQDFSYAFQFFKGIKARFAERPYRLEDQEKLIRSQVPQIQNGMVHAYSPVAFFLVYPLLFLNGQQGYLIYMVFCSLGILLLFHFILLPRITSPLQLLALFILLVNLCLLTTYQLGQSTLATTTLLGVFWFFLKEFGKDRTWSQDFMIAILFWMLCFKPSIAIIPAGILLGAMAWRALGFSLFLLVVTWIMTSSYYGGWWTGFWDYHHLLNHYNNAEFTSFMPHESDSINAIWTYREFYFDKMAILTGASGWIILHWWKRITLSELFIALVWMFLLFSPWLMPTEEWVLCLLVVESSFFLPRTRWVDYGKLLVLLLFMNVPFNYPWTEPVLLILKWGLAAWTLLDAMGQHRAQAAADI